MILTDGQLALIRKHFPLFLRGKTAAQLVAERAERIATRIARERAEKENPDYRSGLSPGRLAKEERIVSEWTRRHLAWLAAGNRPRGVTQVDPKLERRRELTAARVARHRAKKKKMI